MAPPAPRAKYAAVAAVAVAVVAAVVVGAVLGSSSAHGGQGTASQAAAPTAAPTTAQAAAPTAAPTNPPRVLVPTASTVINGAWGVSSGLASIQGQTDGRLVVIVDIDAVAASDVATMHSQGHIVQCYFSIGSAEPFRADYKANTTAWMAATVGKMAGWDEYWLDLSKLPTLMQLQSPRFQRAKSLGCDALELDNVDCYDNTECWQKTGTNLTQDQVQTLQVQYNTWQLKYAHSMGLSVSLKNALGLVPIMGNQYDFFVNEQCFQYSECDSYSSVVAQNKAVFNFEYSSTDVCAQAKSLNIRTSLCAGSGGTCSSGVTWTLCDAAVAPLPAISKTNAP